MSFVYEFNEQTKVLPYRGHVIAKAKSLRIASKRPQAALVHRLNLSSGFVGKVESAISSTKYNLNHLNQLARIFRVSPQYFFPEEHL